MAELTSFEAFWNEKPTLDELCRHVRLKTKWYTFGVLLKLDIMKLDGIRLMNEDGFFKAIKMFELWLSSNPTATRREIIETLRIGAIGEKTIAEDYNKALKENETYCKLKLFFSLYLHIVHDLTDQILQKHSESLSKLFLPMKVVQMLYTEGVISKETYDEIEQSGGLLADGPLRALSSTVTKEPSQLKVFASVLLQSKETVRVGKDALKDYGKYS